MVWGRVAEWQRGRGAEADEVQKLTKGKRGKSSDATGDWRLETRPRNFSKMPAEASLELELELLAFRHISLASYSTTTRSTLSFLQVSTL